jgi:hypothetical protein
LYRLCLFPSADKAIQGIEIEEGMPNFKFFASVTQLNSLSLWAKDTTLCIGRKGDATTLLDGRG